MILRDKQCTVHIFLNLYSNKIKIYFFRYYASTTETNPEFRHIYKGDHCISCHIKSPEDENCNYSTAKFSEDFTYIALTCLGPSPAFTKIYKTDVKHSKLYYIKY